MGSHCCKDDEYVDNDTKTKQSFDHSTTYTCNKCNMDYQTDSLEQPEHCCKHHIFYISSKHKHCCDNNGCGILYTDLHCCYCKTPYTFDESHCQVHHSNYTRNCQQCIKPITCTVCNNTTCECEDDSIL